jgi:RHS repeat-associated protein
VQEKDASNVVTATITRTYDGLDRLTQEVTPQGTVNYTYDNASRRATMTVVGQPQVTYTYDNANRLTTIQQGTSTVTIAYDDADRRTSVTYPNTNKVEYAYNVASELTTVTYKQGTTTLGTLTYTYDAAGNRIKIGGTFARSNISPALTTTNYNANNQQTTFGTTTETYDLNGNLATTTDVGVTTTYTWNARNQLTGISRTGLTTSFTYDSFGRRTGKTINGTTTNFLYDGLNPVQEKNGATVTANLLTGLGIDEFFTRTDGVGVRALLPDVLGSTVALGDNTGTLQTQYTYEPFGVTTQTGATNTNSYKYTGREDDGSGLLYYRARYYQPRFQRFISEDPIEYLGGDTNLYAYVSNSPMMYRDPTGLLSVDVPLLPPEEVNLLAGLGDALLLGLGDDLRALLGINVVDTCDDYYQYGSWASFTLGGARLAYAGLAKGYSLIASSGAAASSFRKQLRDVFRLGLGRGFRKPNLAKYPDDDALRAAAGRTNFPLNVQALGVATAGGVSGSGCGCPKK